MRPFTPTVLASVTLACSTPAPSAAQCRATATSMTPPTWQAPVTVTNGASGGLRLAKEFSLPGPANRFDYQSVDPATGRIYMHHMNAGTTIVFDANRGQVVAEVAGVPRATGVWVVPQHHHVYVSAAGNHEVAVIDDRTLKIVARIAGVRFR